MIYQKALHFWELPRLRKQHPYTLMLILYCGKRQQEEIESLGTGKNFIIVMVFNKRNFCITEAVSLRKHEATWERKLANNHHEQMIHLKKQK